METLTAKKEQILHALFEDCVDRRCHKETLNYKRRDYIVAHLDSPHGEDLQLWVGLTQGEQSTEIAIFSAPDDNSIQEDEPLREQMKRWRCLFSIFFGTVLHRGSLNPPLRPLRRHTGFLMRWDTQSWEANDLRLDMIIKVIAHFHRVRARFPRQGD